MRIKLNLDSEKEYLDHFKEHYCSKKIITHDGIEVTFHEDMFKHAFYIRCARSLKKPKDTFSKERSERMDWIKDVLSDSTIEMKFGWDSYLKRYDNNSRVAMIIEDYVVVIKVLSKTKARFITAYIIDSEKVKNKIAASPTWVNPY